MGDNVREEGKKGGMRRGLAGFAYPEVRSAGPVVGVEAEC